MSCKVSFIGLGVMGYPMAGYISKAGHNVTVYNRTRSKAEIWINEYKGKIANTPEEAAKDSNFIFTCVGNDADLKEVTLEKNGIFRSIQKGAVYIDNTTASAKVARELYEKAKSKNFGFLDAPVSGGQAGAENGALTVMVGGDKADFDKAKPWQMENRYKTMIDDKFDFGFAVDWMRKDLKIAIEEAKKNNSPLPITKIIDEYYGEIQNMGGNRWDTSSLIRRFRKK